MHGLAGPEISPGGLKTSDQLCRVALAPRASRNKGFHLAKPKPSQSIWLCLPFGSKPKFGAKCCEPMARAELIFGWLEVYFRLSRAKKRKLLAGTAEIMSKEELPMQWWIVGLVNKFRSRCRLNTRYLGPFGMVIPKIFVPGLFLEISPRF